MKSIVGLYIAWLIAAVMLAMAVTSPPSINFAHAQRSYSYTHRQFRSHSYGHSYYSHRNDFYTLLRWVCCAAFAYSAITAFQMKRVRWTWIFGSLAVLFNPLAPVYLQRATWQIVDWGAIGVIVVAAIVFWRKKPSIGVVPNDKLPPLPKLT
jgi:hypothetical protein